MTSSGCRGLRNARDARRPALEPVPQRLLLLGEYRAPEGDDLGHRELAALAAERPLIRASGSGPFPGDSLPEAMARIEGELGAPHLPYLPELSALGWKGTLQARTLAMCEGLAFDGASFGWRMVHGTARGARESMMAQDRLLSDINLLADRVGARRSRQIVTVPFSTDSAAETPAPVYKIQVLGPLSLSARVYLPGGERAVSDTGASRDLLESFLEGLARWVTLLREALQDPYAPLAVQFDEPEMQRIMSGTIPTVSGFRALPAMLPHDYQQIYRRVAERCSELNLQVILNVDGTVLKPARELKLRSALGLTLDALALVKAMRLESGAHPVALMFHPDRARPRGAGTLQVPPLSDPRAWETVAQLLEAQVQMWLPLVTAEAVPAQVHRVYGLWREVGLQARQLSAVGLMPDEAGRQSDGGASPSLLEATASLARAAECARALGECGYDY